MKDTRRVVDIDRKIRLVQASTRTLFRVFLPIHDWLRMHSVRYYFWSLKSYSHIVHWTALFLFICALPAVFYSAFQTPQNSKADGVTYDFPRWEWVNPKPTGNDLISTISCTQDQSVWTVGKAGTILKSIDLGSTWSQQYSGTTQKLSGITCINPSNIIAIGDSGTILGYNGISWTAVQTATSNNYNSIVAVDSNHALVVGVAGQITALIYNGSAWSAATVESGTSHYFSSVTKADSTHAIAVGYLGQITALTYNGSVWSATTVVTGSIYTLFSAVATDSTHVLAVGVNGTIHSLVYNGLTWDIVAVTSNTIKSLGSIVATDSTHALAVGTGGQITAITYGGSSWGAVTVGTTGNQLLAISVINSTHAVAVGVQGRITYLSYSGSWVSMDSSKNNNAFNSVTLIDATHFMTVGIAGQMTTIFLDDRDHLNFTTVLYGTTNIFTAIKEADSTHALAVGSNGTINALTYGSSSWDVVPVAATGFSGYFNAVIAVDPTHALAVGTTGQITALTYNGSVWTAITVATGTDDYLAIAKVDTMHAIAVGRTGLVSALTYNGSTWSVANVPTSLIRHFNAVVVMDQTHDLTTGSLALAVGTFGQITALTYDGSAWIPVTVRASTQSVFSAISVIDTTHAMAVGATGQVTSLSYSGSSWTPMTIWGNTTNNFNSVTTIDSTHLIAVGNSGQVTGITYNGSSWSTTTVVSGITNAFNSVAKVDSTHAIAASAASGVNGRIDTFSYNGSSWSIGNAVLPTVNALNQVHVISPTSIFTIGSSGTILHYSSPTSNIATNLLVKLPGQDDFSQDSTSITGTALSARVGMALSVKSYATEKYSSTPSDRYRLSNIPYLTRIISNDPSASSSPPFYLNNSLDEACDAVTDARIASPCGVGTYPYEFHTPGTWTITAQDAGGSGLIAATSSSVTVLPGVPHHYRFTASGLSTPAGVAKELSVGLADLYGNATSDPAGRVVRLSSAPITGLFSSSASGPWTSTLDLTIPAGDPAISASDNKTINFFYLDFAPLSASITASDPLSSLASFSLPVTVTTGAINQASSGVTCTNASLTAGDIVTCTVSVSTTTPNPTISLYSSRSEDTITKITNANGAATFTVYSEKSGVLALLAKDDTDDTWLSQQQTISYAPAAVARVDLSANVAQSIVAGTAFNLTATFYDRFGTRTWPGNLATNSSDKISISNNDDQAGLSATSNLNPNSNPGKHVFNQITLKSAGKRTITIKDEITGASNSMEFTVYAALPSTAGSLFETTKKIVILNKETANLTATLFDTYKNPISGKTTKIENDASLGVLDIANKQTDTNGQAKFLYTPSKAGKDTLTAFMPDNNDPTKNVAFSETITIDIRSDNLVNNVASLVDSLQNSSLAQTVADVAQKVVQATAALGLFPLIANIIGGAPATIHAINYGFSLTMEALGIRRKRKNWGRIFDSTTGKGVEMVLVRLFDQETMRLKDTIVTDLKGKYHFSVQPGVYAISVSKEGFIFPTQIFAKYGIASFKKNASRNNVQYVGQPINIDSKTNLLNIDIPIDPILPKVSFLFRVKILGEDLFSFLIMGLPYIVIPALILGSLLSVFTAIVMPDSRNILLSVVYMALTAGYIISRFLRFSHASTILDVNTKKPLAGVMVSLFQKEDNSLKESRITDRFGRFSIYAPRGHYYLKAQKSGYDFEEGLKQGKNIYIREPSFVKVKIEGSHHKS